jgi:LysM repeat protein
MRVIVPTGGALSTSVARRVANPVEPASSSPTGFHRVRRGETLSGLAAEYGVTVRQLKAWNALGTKESIRAGQRLRVAPPAGRGSRTEAPTTAVASGDRVHTVRRGDTLSALAKHYGVSVQALLEANHLSANESLKAGTTLRIPG